MGCPVNEVEEKPENPSTSALPAYIAELKNVNIDTLTPIEALNLVYSLKKELNHEA